MPTVTVFCFPLLALVTLFAADDPSPTVAKLKEHVAILASPEYEGRRGAGGLKAAAYVERAFVDLKLEPLFDGSYRQDIPGREPGKVIGVNIGARIIGSDPKLRDEWIILAAHFDHLGKRGDVVYPGADDNASAVAMMLESARCLVQGSKLPKRSIMLIGFDLEEIGLFGSRYFVEHMPIALNKVKLFITADMIARSLAGITGDTVFVFGTERSPSLRPIISLASRDLPLTVGFLGSDIMILDRSDYGPFRYREIPFLFFSTGESEHYHRPSDVVETLNYPKFDAITQMMYRIVREVVDLPQLPGWLPVADNSIAEAEAMDQTLKIFISNEKQLELTPAQVFLIRNARTTLQRVIKRGHYEGSERLIVIAVARIILSTAL